METGVESDLWMLNKSANLYRNKLFISVECIVGIFYNSNYFFPREIVKYGAGEQENNFTDPILKLRFSQNRLTRGFYKDRSHVTQ